jgi:hypothetical protein
MEYRVVSNVIEGPFHENMGNMSPSQEAAIIKKKLTDFSRDINEHLSQGWAPQGGISITYDNGTGKLIITQALIK